MHDPALLAPEVLLEHLVKSLVDHPEQVRIDPPVGESMAVFEIHVADSDVGRVLGKRGCYADALRLLFTAIYGKQGKRLHLQVVEPRPR